MARNLVINDGRSERSLLLVANMVVGRDPVCEISDDDSLLSRRHAEFVVSGGDVVVRDLGSRNGVYVNGLKVAERPLRSGDLVRIGHLEMRYVEDATPLASALAAAVADSTAFVPAGVPPPVTPAASGGTAASDDEERTRLVRAPGLQVPAGPPEADEEYTRVVRPPTMRMPAAPEPSASTDDEERTRLLRAPVSPAATLESGDVEPNVSDRTIVVAVPAPAVAPPVEPVLARVPIPAAKAQLATEESAPAPQAVGAGFVFAHVAALALIVSAAAMAPFLVKGENPLDGIGLAGPGLSAAVIVLTTYVLGARIAQRVRAVLQGQGRD